MKTIGIIQTIAVGGAVFATLFLFSPNVSACTCGELTVAELKSNAGSVFLGRVTSKKKSDEVEKDGVRVRLKVERVWKGRLRNTVFVYTGATDDLYPFFNLCATPFKVGRRYVVFTYGRDRLLTDVCAGTTGFPYAKEVLGQLEKNKVGG